MTFSVGSRIDHELYGEGIISRINLSTLEVFFSKAGKMEITKSGKFEVTETPDNEIVAEEQPTLNFEEIERAVIFTIESLGAMTDNVPLGDRWTGGKIVIHPKDSTLQTKEIPIDNFFHKIVMLRDRLRVLEQNINSHQKLTDEDKVNLQQYITRIYGSLTTFNFLFREARHQFVGAGKKEE